MEELSTGRRRSSVGRLLNAFVPKRGPTLTSLIDLTPLEIDLLMSYQLSLSQPLFLGAAAFLAARIVEKGDLSARIHDTLSKLQIINAPPSDLNEPYQPVDTTKISRNLPNQLFFVGGLILRRIVALLFVWEEQCVRLRMLDDEEREIRTVLSNPPPGLEQELQIRLHAVQLRRATLPSQQQGDGSGELDELPAYAGA